MQSHFIRTCAALGTIGLAGSAIAGDTTRFDVGWSNIDIFFIDFAATFFIYGLLNFLVVFYVK